MGIREEIWQVVSEGMGVVIEGGEDMVSRSLYRQRNRIVEAIFSILDEHLGEHRRDWHFTSHELALLEIWDGLLPKGPHEVIEFDSGDHISIYVRKER